MTLQQTTQQFTPILLGLSLVTLDQVSAVEIFLAESLFSRDALSAKSATSSGKQKPVASTQPTALHPDHNQASSYSENKQNFTNNIIWLNHISHPLGIEQWRDLLPQIQSMISNRTLVITILQADTLSLATQNAMLKSLEEPPPNVQFVLVSNQPDTLLPTIQSRCLLIRYSISTHHHQPVSVDKNKPLVDQSIGHELIKNDSAYPTTQSTLLEAHELIKSIMAGSTATALIASDQFKDRDQAKGWIIQVLDWSQKRLSQMSQKEQVTSLNSNDQEETTYLDYPTWITALLTALQQLEQNLHVKLVMDQLFLTLVNKPTSST